MIKTIGAYVNVALADYDEAMQNHLVELLKDSLREQSTEYIFENTWEVIESKRTLYKNGDGQWEVQGKECFSDVPSRSSEPRETLDVMTINLTVKVEEDISEKI